MLDTADILADLLRLEPIFHRPKYPTVMADDYWEIGASGKRYDRDFILDHLAANPPVDAAAADWQISDPQVRRIAADIFLLNYTLDQRPRLTHRATLWQRGPEGWKILYHQGTIAS